MNVSRRTESDEAPVEREGTIDFFNDSKGFGFIKESGNGWKNTLLHISGLIDDVKEGNLVYLWTLKEVQKEWMPWTLRKYNFKTARYQIAVFLSCDFFYSFIFENIQHEQSPHS